MIYLSDDYIGKYSDTLSYLIGRSYSEGYTFDFIEKSISYSLAINELEKSNVTLIAFSSMEKIYSDIFPIHNNNYEFNPYDVFGWVGNTYIHLFLSLKITFEALFNVISIKEMMELYKLYHEMDFIQILDYAKERMKYSLLDVVMKRMGVTTQELANLTSLPFATINALRYGKRKISKLESRTLLIISHTLNVKMETLLDNII